jgi:glucose-1-phosphate cytidylyltransferase
MKVVILAGGMGTRLSEETEVRPKPMVEIGGRPILWHIMKTYAAYGFKEFILALGYKGEFIKNYFINYHQLHSNLTVCLKDGLVDVHDGEAEDWTIHLVDTGLKTETGGRIKRLASLIGNERFLLTYGDGVSNVDVRELTAFHQQQGRLATVTAVRPPARFGGMVLADDHVVEFKEKPQVGEGWINGGFFVLEPQVFGYIRGDATDWERESVEMLVAENQLSAFQHRGFWQCMDTLRDVRYLQGLWQSGDAPWKVWDS